MAEITSTTEAARLHVLFLCLMRHIVEKHGGTMRTDATTHKAHISIPQSKKTICFQELGKLPTYNELNPCYRVI
ncbi:MAG: hypothetical protein JRF28_01190 [Deltaproteobacteria bacterium]|nr:hypothetical protein [Deltaproteobacteria bacterium]